MITWLQNLLLKHNSWLMSSLLVVIIAVFVLSVGPTSFFKQSNERERASVEYYGFNLKDPNTVRELQAKAQVSFSLNRPPAISGPQDYFYGRVAALGLANQLGIVNPTQDELKVYVRGLQVFQDPQTGEFSTERYKQIVETVTGNDMLDEKSFNELLREDWKIQQVVEAMSGPGYGNEFIGYKQFEGRETTYDIAIAELNYENFEFTEQPTDEELEAYYNQNPGAYTEPEKIDATAVIFPVAQYLDKVPPLQENEIQNYYNRNGWRYMGEPTVNAETGEQEQPQPLPLEEARPQVMADLKRERARGLAARAAEDFAVALNEQEVARDSEQFDALVQHYQAKLEDIEPYSRNNLPTDNSQLSRAVLQDLWNYTAGGRYYSSPAQTNAGGVVLLRDKIIPETVPPYASAWEQVEQDWRDENKRRAFTARGQELRKQLREAVANGEDFVTAAQDLGLTVREPEPFLGDEVPRELLQDRSWEQARQLAVHDLTPMIQREGKGMFVYIQDKQVPEISPDSEEVKQYVAENAEQLAPVFGWQAVMEVANQTLRSLSEQEEAAQQGA